VAFAFGWSRLSAPRRIDKESSALPQAAAQAPPKKLQQLTNYDRNLDFFE